MEKLIEYTKLDNSLSDSAAHGAQISAPQYQGETSESCFPRSLSQFCPHLQNVATLAKTHTPNGSTTLKQLTFFSARWLQLLLKLTLVYCSIHGGRGIFRFLWCRLSNGWKVEGFAEMPSEFTAAWILILFHRRVLLDRAMFQRNSSSVMNSPPGNKKSVIF